MELLTVVQIFLGLGLIITIAIQAKAGGLGRSFGGSATYFTRRGAEKFIFKLTVAFLITFVLSSIFSFLA